MGLKQSISTLFLNKYGNVIFLINKFDELDDTNAALKNISVIVTIITGITTC